MKNSFMFLIAISMILLASCFYTPTPAAFGSTGLDIPSDKSVPYVIEYYMLANSASYEVEDIMNEINKIILPKFNATININMIDWGNWFPKINGDIRAGKKVDIVFTADWFQYMDSIASGYFLPLNDLLDQYGPQTRAQLGETFITGCQVNGVLYGIPTDKELAVNGGFVYNKTLLEKYGLEVETSWKSLRDWEPILKVIKENEPDICPVIMEGDWFHHNYIGFLPCELVFDGNKNDDTIQWIYDYPWYMDELRTIRDFFLKGYIPAEMSWMSEADMRDWSNNRILKGDFFLLSVPLKPGKGKSTELIAPLINSGIEYDEIETYPLMVNTRHCGGSMLAIPVTSKDPVKAMQFINEMHTNPDVTNLLAWGIEGKQYTVVSENPKRVKPMENSSWTSAVLVWTLGNVFNVYLSDVEPEDKYVMLAATKEGVQEHIANGFRFDPREYQSIITTIKAVMDEYVIPIRVGAIDPDEGVAALRAEIDAAGFQELKAAVIEKFQKWLTTKQ